MEDVATPGTTTIAALADLPRHRRERTAKAAFFVTGDGRLVTAIVRGDYDVNETKLVNAVKAAGGLRPATVEEIKARGHGAGLRLADRRARHDGRRRRARRPLAEPRRRREPRGLPLRNVNVGRDFTPDLVADITNAREGDPCPTVRQAGQAAQRDRGRQHLQARDEFTDAFGATYLGEDGQAHPIVMGSYGIGLGRNVACIVEAHHDEKGIVWPAEVAPYAAHLVTDRREQGPAGRRDRRAPPRAALAAGPAARSCTTTATSRPGVKFTDAELLGMPWILTVSPRSLAAGGVEVTDRATGERTTAPIEEVEASLVGS